MKHLLLKTLFIGLFFIGLNSVDAQETLERSLERQARYIVRTIPSDSVVAVVNVRSDSSRLSDYIMTRISDHVVGNRRGLSFVDRNQLDLLRQEINFQYSGEVSEETMVAIGKMVGAQYIVTGSVIDAGLHYNFNFRLLEVVSARIIGSNSATVLHDDQMNGFLPNSSVAQAQRRQAQQAQQERDRTNTNIQNSLGLFSNGFYVGYIGSLQTPIGISVGGISNGVFVFLDNEFGPPNFRGNSRSDLTYIGDTVQNPSSGKTYTADPNNITDFTWYLTTGVNINLIRTLLWANLGAGFEYRQEYKLFTDNSNGSKSWAKEENESDGYDLRFTVSAGLYVKIWYFYIQGKYKYVFGEALDTNTFGLNHLSLGAGFVWRRR